MLLNAIKQQRLVLACAMTVGFLLVAVLRAPVLPVLAGCCLSLAFFIFKAASKSSSRRADH